MNGAPEVLISFDVWATRQPILQTNFSLSRVILVRPKVRITAIFIVFVDFMACSCKLSQATFIHSTVSLDCFCLIYIISLLCVYEHLNLLLQFAALWIAGFHRNV